MMLQATKHRNNYKMFVYLTAMVALVIAVEPGIENDPATYQVSYFKEQTKGPVGVLTTSSGEPVSYTEATSTFNTRLHDNNYYMDLITHVNRETLPGRIVHGRAAAAFGYIEITKNISFICKADFLKEVGKRTPVAIRFSLANSDIGTPDLTRGVHGFAIKFYTEEGNFDIPGFDTPMYFYKDPIHFAHIRHAVSRNPATNLIDWTTFWDVITNLPEMLHMMLLVFADRGIPFSYINIPGFGIHTYQVTNDKGEQFFVRFHFMPHAGIKHLTSAEAGYINARDPDYLTRDLYRVIANGDFPSWTASVQILTTEDVTKLGPRAFDVTRVIPLDEYPLYEFGKIVLNRNPKNFHAEVEQLAFSLAHLVPGILGGVDKMYEARRFAYRDSEIYRLGVNFNKIAVNRPSQVKTFTYNRDGVSPVLDNEGGIPHYYPNSFHGPIPYMNKDTSRLIKIPEFPSENFDQASSLYENELVGDQRERLIENLLFTLRQVAKSVQIRVIHLFTFVNPDLGKRIRQGLNMTVY